MQLYLRQYVNTHLPSNKQVVLDQKISSTLISLLSTTGMANLMIRGYLSFLFPNIQGSVPQTNVLLLLMQSACVPIFLTQTVFCKTASLNIFKCIFLYLNTEGLSQILGLLVLPGFILVLRKYVMESTDVLKLNLEPNLIIDD